MFFSIIIPVYNRPEEIKELLQSLALQDFQEKFEIVIVEDGSSIMCENEVELFKGKLDISYYLKYNSGPGDSRNFGMNLAKGDYFILFDSDCVIPTNYLSQIAASLKNNYVDFYGGSDKADENFSNIQKAINFAMTSFLTTGGIRGGSEKFNKFEPRSFNMGLSKKAFLESNGFGNIHPGEDPDLTIRLWKLGFKSKLIPEAFVYHKRRIDFNNFSNQILKFGKARPILNFWHPEYAKYTYYLPSLFVIGFFVSIVSIILLKDFLIKMYCLYFFIIFIVSSIQNKNITIGYLSVKAVWKMFFNYGIGFIESFYKINIQKQKPEAAFDELFFKV
jgi:glycosyltransferase involved in cell wall biosynthesis